MSELKTDAPGRHARTRRRSPGMLGDALLASLLVSLPATGGLRAAEPSAQDPREEAARLNSLGIDLYKKQQYGAAVDQLGAAYRLDPDPSILCNLARAQYKLLPGAAAVAHLEKCLASDTTLSDTSRTTLEGYLKDARQRTASDGPEPAPAPLAVAPVTVKPAAAAPGRPLWRLALGGGLTAAGAGLIIGGGVAWSLHGQCATPDPPCERIYKTEPGGAIAVTLGAAAVIGGVVLLAWPPARPRLTAGK